VIIISPLKRDFLYFSLPSRVFKTLEKRRAGAIQDDNREVVAGGGCLGLPCICRRNKKIKIRWNIL
jgi:hypothetical protein